MSGKEFEKNQNTTKTSDNVCRKRFQDSPKDRSEDGYLYNSFIKRFDKTKIERFC